MDRDLKHFKDLCVSQQQVAAIHNSVQDTYRLLGRPLFAIEAQRCARRAHANMEWMLTQLVYSEYQ